MAGAEHSALSRPGHRASVAFGNAVWPALPLPLRNPLDSLQWVNTVGENVAPRATGSLRMES